MSKRLAQIISLVFDPRVEVPLLLAAAVGNLYANGAKLEFLALLLLIDVGLPLLVYGWLKLEGRISDGEISRRGERIPLYGAICRAHLGGVILAVVLGQAELALLLLLFWLLACVFTAVTLVWKISVHAGVNAALAAFLGLGPLRGGWWLAALVAVVGWSRIKLKKHGIGQAAVGAVLGGGGVIVGMELLGL